MLEELASAVRDGEVDPVDLVEESLRRIEESHGDLNAVVAVHADEARAAARDHPRTGALAGLPLLVKDMALCAGSRTTFGSPLYAEAAPDDRDDIAVARLRDEGAIVVGRTNTPAFGHTAVTTNLLFGSTRNPWNTERSPGGSSGGSAAALAAGLAPLATTSDGGGSVRIPASLCGLVGLKPTMGTVGRNVLPRWIEFSTQGPTASTVADVVHLGRIMAGPAPGDWISHPAGTADLTPARPARVLACRTFRAGVDPTIEANYRATLDALYDAGLAVDEVPAPADPGTIFDWFLMASAELAATLDDVRDQWDDFEDSLRDMLAFGSAVTLPDYIQAQRRRHELGQRIDDLVGEDSVLVLPTLNIPSWAPEGPIPDWAVGIEGDPTIATNTPELNASGHPAASVPMGLDGDGVPTGLQVVAPRFRDGLALGVAEVLEQVRPWPLVAPGYQPFNASVMP
jgi:Asp-tRNA(Asn)/Glu-tRNA(Gln) amidotransferase A subunit family amidase